MADVLVVADDLTGGNAAAGGFAREGFRAATASAVDRPDVVAEMVARFDVVVASVDCRHVESHVARERFASVVRAGWPVPLVCNRIDATLRGNVGATTRALIDEVTGLSGSRVVVLCTPAYPGAGRHTIGGMQLLGGRRLEETEVARDARSPVDSSDVASILRRQADLAVAGVPLAAVTGEQGELVAAIRRAIETGAEVVLADATTDEHLARVAHAAVVATADIEVVWGSWDPGPGSLALARALGLGSHAQGAPLLAVSGSATELTRAQLRQLIAERGASAHRTVGNGVVPDVDATSRLLGEALSQAGPGEIVLLATVLDESDVCKPTPEEAELIPRALARAVRRNLEAHAVDGLYSTGGDVTAALLAELGSHGLEITDEVEPLAVAGSVVGGPWSGLPVVTKGGLVGDPATAVACLDHLRHNADRHRRQVIPFEPRHPR